MFTLLSICPYLSKQTEDRARREETGREGEVEGGTDRWKERGRERERELSVPVVWLTSVMI